MTYASVEILGKPNRPPVRWVLWASPREGESIVWYSLYANRQRLRVTTGAKSKQSLAVGLTPTGTNHLLERVTQFMNIYKPIRDGPSTKLINGWSFVENLMPQISSSGRQWALPRFVDDPWPPGNRDQDNDLSRSWH